MGAGEGGLEGAGVCVGIVGAGGLLRCKGKVVCSPVSFQWVCWSLSNMLVLV